MSDRCPCGGIILADTEDWKTPLCYTCYTDLHKGYTELVNKYVDLKHQLEAIKAGSPKPRKGDWE